MTIVRRIVLFLALPAILLAVWWFTSADSAITCSRRWKDPGGAAADLVR